MSLVFWIAWDPISAAGPSRLSFHDRGSDSIQTSQSLEFCSDGAGREIYQMFAPSDAALMHDSVLPAEARYDLSENPAPREQGEVTE